MDWWTTELLRRIKWAGGLSMLVEIVVFVDKIFLVKIAVFRNGESIIFVDRSITVVSNFGTAPFNQIRPKSIILGCSFGHTHTHWADNSYGVDRQVVVAASSISNCNDNDLQFGIEGVDYYPV